MLMQTMVGYKLNFDDGTTVIDHGNYKMTYLITGGIVVPLCVYGVDFHHLRDARETLHPMNFSLSLLVLKMAGF